MVTFALRSRLPLVRNRPGGWLPWSSVAAGVARIAVVGSQIPRHWASGHGPLNCR
jgi:hypothetical protein